MSRPKKVPVWNGPEEEKPVEISEAEVAAYRRTREGRKEARRQTSGEYWWMGNGGLQSSHGPALTRRLVEDTADTVNYGRGGVSSEEFARLQSEFIDRILPALPPPRLTDEHRRFLDMMDRIFADMMRHS